MKKFIKKIERMLHNHGIYLSSEDFDFLNEDKLIKILQDEIGINIYQFNILGPSAIISTNPDVRLVSQHKIDLTLQQSIYVPDTKRELISAALYNIPYYVVSISRNSDDLLYKINVDSVLYGLVTTVFYQETNEIDQETLVKLLVNNIGFSEKYWNYYINMRNIFPILTNK